MYSGREGSFLHFEATEQPYGMMVMVALDKEAGGENEGKQLIGYLQQPQKDQQVEFGRKRKKIDEEDATQEKWDGNEEKKKKEEKDEIIAEKNKAEIHLMEERDEEKIAKVKRKREYEVVKEGKHNCGQKELVAVPLKDIQVLEETTPVSDDINRLGLLQEVANLMRVSGRAADRKSREELLKKKKKTEGPELAKKPTELEFGLYTRVWCLVCVY